MSDMTPPPPPPSEPAASGGPGPGGRKLDAGVAISYGWNGLIKNLAPLLLISLVVVVIQIGFTVVGSFFDNWILLLTWNIIATIVSLILAMGLIRAALTVVDGGVPDVALLFRTDGLVPYLIASILVGLAVGVGLILCIIPGLILAFAFAFYGYAIVDGKTDDGIEAMKMSWSVVSANVGALIAVFLLAFLINIVGAVLCGVGLLFTYPLTAIAIGYAWRTISGGKVAQLT